MCGFKSHQAHHYYYAGNFDIIWGMTMLGRVFSFRALTALLMMCVVSVSNALTIYDNYRSPRNPERSVRKSTSLIVLHTTEAPAKGSLNKLSARGECHFCITEEGKIYRIIDKNREAFHAGLSMWNGKEDVDKFSIGIECVGYHNKLMGNAQLNAIRDLVKLLKAEYKIADDHVVCHSHVAYGKPNRWQKRKHRGRKRCGMLFAMPSVRKRLGLKARPTVDADVKAKRLVVADTYLKNVLYGKFDTMAAILEKKSNAPKSINELKKQGYALKGTISKDKTALKIAGTKWNSKETYYTIRNKVVPGNELDDAHIEKGMGVWMKK